MRKLLAVTGFAILNCSAINGAGAADLNEVVALALQSSPGVLEAGNERLARDHALRYARGDYLPTLDLVVGAGLVRSDNPSTRFQGVDENSLTPIEVELQATQLLFDGFAVQSEAARQKARIESAAYSVFGTAELAGLRAADVYLEAMRHRELLDLARENLDAHVTIYNQIEARSGSVGRRSDLDQVTGRLALARSNVLVDEFNVTDADTNYLRVVNEMPQDLERPMPPAERLPKSMEDAVSTALAGHPTLKQAEADIEASLAEHRGTRNGYYPRFDIVAFADVNSDIDGLEGDNNDIGVMFRMRWNLYRGGRDSARIRESAAYVERNREIRNNTHRQVVESIRLSWISYQATSDQLVYLRERADASGRTRDAYKQQFDIGQRSLLDLLDTENEFIDARRALVAAEYENLYAQYRILAGTGQLLLALDIDLPETALLGDDPEPELEPES